eukprot:6214643-Pleurochrysis_carterae.AAC.1
MSFQTALVAIGLRREPIQSCACAAPTAAANGARAKRDLATTWLAGAEGSPLKVASRRGRHRCASDGEACSRHGRGQRDAARACAVHSGGCAVEEMPAVEAIEAALVAARGRDDDGVDMEGRAKRTAVAGATCVVALREIKKC